MIRLVLSDMDGTLIPFGQRSASPRTVAAIRSLEEAGIRFGLATGRDVGELSMFLGDPKLYGTGILSNGKKIMLDGELVCYSLIDNDALRRVGAYVSQFEGCFITAFPFDKDGTAPVYCVNAPESEVARVSQAFGLNCKMASEVPDVDIIGATISCSQDQEVLDLIKRESALVCPEFDFLQPAPHWCDILPRGLNKGSALSMLLNAAGITADEIVVFGDAENDLALFGAVENSVAVANATPAAWAAAHWHIGTSEDDAVAQALEDIACAARNGGVPAFMRDES